MSMRRKTGVQYGSFLGFIVVAGTALALALLAAYRFYPRRPTLLDLLMALRNPRQQIEHLPWWRRLLSTGRPDPAREPRPPAPERNVRHGRVPRGGQPAHGPALSEEQLALRETALAQLILSQRYAVSEAEAWATVRRARGDGDFRRYEEGRLLAELLWIKYEDKIERRKTLREIHKKVMELVRAPSAGFEDQLNAGVGSLLSGDATGAMPYLREALRTWPARDRMRGNAYLSLIICYAVTDRGARMFALLDDFRENFPDWLYVETYLPDVVDLEKIYGAPPLLLVVHGRLLQVTADDARAAVLYERALAAGQLTPATTTRVQAWLAETRRHEP